MASDVIAARDTRLYYPTARAILKVVLEDFGAGPDGESAGVTLPVLPTKVTIHRNSYHQADSFDLEFSALDLPHDPVLIRSGEAEIWLYDQGGIDDQRVLNRQYATTEDPSNLTGRTATDVLAIERGDQDAIRRFTGGRPSVIVGLFDSDSVSYSGSGKWCSIKGQDYTAFLVGKQWPPTKAGLARRIPTGNTRIDKWAQVILDELKSSSRFADAGGLRVRLEGLSEFEAPSVGKGEIESHRRGLHAKQGTSYWDVIYGTCLRYGLIAYVQGREVVIAKPKNLEDAKASSLRRMRWGQNVEAIEMTRNLAKEKTPRIVVRFYDPAKKKTDTVEYPDGGPKKKQAEMSKTPSKKTAFTEKAQSTAKASTAKKTETLDDEYQLHTVYGIHDKAILEEMAKTLYWLKNRGERKLVVKTRDLVDCDGRGILNLTSGDAALVEWVGIDREAFQAMKTDEERQYALESVGYNPEAAAFFARHWNLFLNQERPMRVKEVTYDYDAEGGVSVEMELQDFVIQGGQR